MKKNKLSIDFSFSIKEVVDLNKSFALAKVAIAYAGRNRNQSSISKEAFERALPSIKNIPVVGRYDEENNCFGGHDVKVISSNDGVQLVNATTPFGVVPESANQYWETVTEADGNQREYLFTDILLWKRQHGYEYLAEKQRIGQSMEISFDSYIVDKDSYCVIDSFNFEALCLIDCEPCFESASMQLASDKEFADYSLKFSQMISDLKELSKEQSVKLDFSKFNTQEGGNSLTKEMIDAILAEYELTSEELDFEVAEDITEEDFRAKLDEFKKKKCSAEEPTVEPEAEPVADPEPTPDPEPEFSVTKEEYEQLKADLEASHNAFEQMKSEFDLYKGNYSTPNSEVEELKTFKANVLAEQRTAEETELFSKFDEKLNEVEEYSALKENCKDMTLEAISDKCFALLGKKLAQFSYAPKPKSNIIKVPVANDNEPLAKSPYGDLYDRYLKK